MNKDIAIELIKYLDYEDIYNCLLLSKKWNKCLDTIQVFKLLINRDVKSTNLSHHKDLLECEDLKKMKQYYKSNILGYLCIGQNLFLPIKVNRKFMVIHDRYIVLDENSNLIIFNRNLESRDLGKCNEFYRMNESKICFFGDIFKDSTGEFRDMNIIDFHKDSISLDVDIGLDISGTRFEYTDIQDIEYIVDDCRIYFKLLNKKYLYIFNNHKLETTLWWTPKKDYPNYYICNWNIIKKENSTSNRWCSII